ncbi:MAG: hypothetical protein OZ924_17545, partial [Burkholderiaceae bacterium]|nr:hypothetical protein [Burkholderiaceae bacterium]
CGAARPRALRRHHRGPSAAQDATDATLLARQAGEPGARSGRSTLEVRLNGDPWNFLCAKQPTRQVDVAADIAAQVAGGSRHVMGVMVESHLVAGRQAFTPGSDGPAKLAYGQSITDSCLGWDDSVKVLETLDRAVTTRRQADSSRTRHRG